MGDETNKKVHRFFTIRHGVADRRLKTFPVYVSTLSIRGKARIVKYDFFLTSYILNKQA